MARPAHISEQIEGVPARGGFTLVELVVGLSVLLLLGSLILPLLSHGRVAAQRSQCASNLRQIGIGLHLYANANGGQLPQTRHSTGFRKETAWLYTLQEYIGDVDEIRVSPADPPERQKRILDGGFTSYVANDLVFDSAQFSNLLNLPQPPKTMLFFVLSEDVSPSGTSEHIHGGEWTTWQAILNDIEPDRHRFGERASNRLKGNSPYLFADGHVEIIEPKDLKALVQSGVNPALPPM